MRLYQTTGACCLLLPKYGRRSGRKGWRKKAFWFPSCLLWRGWAPQLSCPLTVGKLGKLVHSILHYQLQGEVGSIAKQFCLLSLLPKDVSHLHRVEGNDLRSSKRKSCCLSLSQESTCLRKSCRWKNYYSGLQSLRTEWLGHFVTIVNNLKPSREKQ